MYNIDFNKVISWVLPDEWRKPKRTAWLFSLLKSYRNTQNKFIALNEKNDFYIKYLPGRLIQVERLLNDVFGTGVYIENQSANVEPFFAYETDNTNNRFAGSKDDGFNNYAYPTDTYEFNRVNFIVYVPAYLHANLKEIKANISRFKRVGQNFQITEI